MTAITPLGQKVVRCYSHPPPLVVNKYFKNFLRKIVITGGDYNTGRLLDRVVLQRSFRAFLPNFESSGVIAVISGVDFRTEWCNSGHSGRQFLDRVVLQRSIRAPKKNIKFTFVCKNYHFYHYFSINNIRYSNENFCSQFIYSQFAQKRAKKYI